MLRCESYSVLFPEPAVRNAIGAGREKIARIVIAFFLHRVTTFNKGRNQISGVLIDPAL